MKLLSQLRHTQRLGRNEVVRENVRKLEAYVEEMASGDTVSGAVNIQNVQDDVLKLWSVVKALPEISSDQKNRIKSLYEGVVRSLNNPDSNPRPIPRSRRTSSQFLQPQVTGVTAVTSLSSDKIPLLHLKRKVGNTWEYSSNLTGVYLDILHEIATSGTTFKDKNTLLTGVGKGSIGVEVVKGLLSGGANGWSVTECHYWYHTWKPQQRVGIVAGNPGVFLGNPHPYPAKPVPLVRGTGFCG